MNYYELEKDEDEVLAAVERGEFVPVKNEKQALREVQLAAKNAGQKPRNINIRISEKVLHKLKVKAAQEGIPYQTLAASILHQHTR